MHLDKRLPGEKGGKLSYYFIFMTLTIKLKILITLFTCGSFAVNGIAQTISLSNEWTYTMGGKTDPALAKVSEKEMPWVEKDTAMRNTGLVIFRRKVTFLFIKK